MKPRAVATISSLSRGVLAALSLVLFLPIAGMGLQSREALEQFHNGTLARWPSGKLFWSDPARYLSNANLWLAERAFPIITSTYLSHNVLYSMFRLSPQPNISVSRNGFIFLTGSDSGSVYDLITRSCLDPLGDEGSRLQSAIDDTARFAREHGYPIDVVLVPTIPTLYGDRLPRSIPPRFRAACAERAAGKSSLAGVHSPQHTTRFLYPFPDMRARRDDWAFYPNANFHPEGLSVKIVRDVYLREIGVTEGVGDHVQLSVGPSELLLDHGIHADFPVYQVSNDAAKVDQAAEDEMRSALARFYSNPPNPHVYKNPNAVAPQRVLMITDSFGYNEGISFAAAFREVVQVSLPERDIVGLLAEVSRVAPFDRVVLLFNDGNVGSVIGIGQALESALPAPPL